VLSIQTNIESKPLTPRAQGPTLWGISVENQIVMHVPGVETVETILMGSTMGVYA
jgi:hypothetical protein